MGISSWLEVPRPGFREIDAMVPQCSAPRRTKRTEGQVFMHASTMRRLLSSVSARTGPMTIIDSVSNLCIAFRCTAASSALFFVKQERSDCATPAHSMLMLDSPEYTPLILSRASAT